MFSLKVVTPYAIGFLLSYSRRACSPMISIGSYIDFLLKFTLAFGVVFELPLAITLLSRMGVVTPAMLARTASTRSSAPSSRAVPPRLPTRSTSPDGGPADHPLRGGHHLRPLVRPPPQDRRGADGKLRMKGAEMLVRCLEHEGVRYVFGVPARRRWRSWTRGWIRDHLRVVPPRAGGRVHGRRVGPAERPGRVCLARSDRDDEPMTGVGDANLDARPWWRSPARRAAIASTRNLTSTRHRRHVPPDTKWNTRLDCRPSSRGRTQGVQGRGDGEAGRCHLELPEDVADEAVPAGARASTERHRRRRPTAPRCGARRNLSTAPSGPDLCR